MAGVASGYVLPENAVVVAVRAEREISKTALAWALTHVVRPGDFVTLLAVICNHDKGHRKRFWSFPKFSSDCSSNRRGGLSEDRRKCEVSASCSQMALQFHGFQDQNEVNMRIKVVVSTEEASPGSKDGGAVVAESKRVGANWIVLDRQLKQEAKHCMQELPHCSVVLMKRSHAKVLRLNLGGAVPIQKIHPPVPTFTLSAPARAEQPCERHRLLEEEEAQPHCLKHSTPRSSSQEEEAALASFLREDRASSSSSSTATGGSSSFFVCEQNPLYEGIREAMLRSKEEGAVESFGSPVCSANPWLEYCQTGDYRDSSSPADLKRLQSAAPNSHPYCRLPPSSTHSGRHVYGAPTNQVYVNCPLSHSIAEEPDCSFMGTMSPQEKYGESDHESVLAGWIAPQHEDIGGDYAYKSDVRDAVSLFGSSPSIPPPLCSICRHKAPVFGKPPRWFRYEELEEATGGFSEANLLAEGGFGWVHRGVLRDGQVVAVKRLKTVDGPKGDEEFQAEVEVLSRAQHRNVVMLVGFCVERTRRVLVYEYICNGSLATHLYGRNKPPLDWHARYRIAVGSARGLRYLHEDCRVGFIHRDVRPNNILLTHDFEPLVGDFGLARWQAEGYSMDTRIIGTFGYLAPEYIESGMITEKADVYAFGVVLLELITGRRAMDTGRPKGQQFLTEWARPALSLASDGEGSIAVDRLLDPRLDADKTRIFSHQVNAMARAASLCLRREPQSRPSMSKVLRLLEGESMVDPGFRAHSKDSRSARFGNPVVNRQGGMKGSLSQRIPREAVARALYEEMGRTQIY
ncbi:hypothetical protein Taro_007402 [Colocasia esculenta]|uniref:Protein kinase domain-containing protein n=1 Tax=Colocasia esculenta TaxID=4460 RepID=A0A843TU03_COLES|nr:hypothetical protein [Colocasia esculenta]